MPPQLVLNLSNGETATFSTFGGTMIGTGTDKLAAKRGEYDGTSNGSLSGSTLNIQVRWVARFFTAGSDFPADVDSTFTGTVGPDGMARGSAVDNTGFRVDWTSRDKFTCVDASAPQPKPQPEPVQVLPPGQPSAVVNADVDLYDAPGGDGNVIGILREGEKVYLDRPCPPADWCQISGRGWAWGDFLQ
jgi:hypothetical protein